MEDRIKKLEHRIEVLEASYKHNLYILERYISVTLIELQKKYSVKIDGEGFIYYLSSNNPFRKEVEKLLK